MGWLLLALAALLVLGLGGIALPELLGPVFAGFAPLLFVIALIGIGAVWWRHAGRRVDADPASPAASRESPGELRGEDDRVET